MVITGKKKSKYNKDKLEEKPIERRKKPIAISM